MTLPSRPDVAGPTDKPDPTHEPNLPTPDIRHARNTPVPLGVNVEVFGQHDVADVAASDIDIGLLDIVE
jgi:hypothetical protein